MSLCVCVFVCLCVCVSVCSRSVARKETLGVHQKNWVCHIYCQINAQQKNKKTSMLIGY